MAQSNDNNFGDDRAAEPTPRAGEERAPWNRIYGQSETRFTRLSRDSIVRLTTNDAESQNDRNRAYETLRAGGNHEGPERMERRWEESVERRRQYAADRHIFRQLAAERAERAAERAEGAGRAETEQN